MLHSPIATDPIPRVARQARYCIVPLQIQAPGEFHQCKLCLNTDAYKREQIPDYKACSRSSILPLAAEIKGMRVVETQVRFHAEVLHTQRATPSTYIQIFNLLTRAFCHLVLDFKRFIFLILRKHGKPRRRKTTFELYHSSLVLMFEQLWWTGIEFKTRMNIWECQALLSRLGTIYSSFSLLP